ncbi:hypothetical protein HZC21_00185 [Candidatus Peregrinibacteria bacterium]|nr:hypothetical protein [Candidatus Peregrinibacteria bacterium]
MAGSAEHRPDEARHEGGAGSPPAVPGVRSTERTLEGSWKGIKWISNYTWQLVRSVFGGAWEATGGVVGGSIMDTGRQIGKAGHEIAETAKHSAEEVGRERNIGKIGPIIGGIMSGTATAVGRTLEWPFTVVGGAAKRIFTGISRPVSGLIKEYDEAKGRGGASSGGETLAHAG